MSRIIEGLEEEFGRDELAKVDSEGRCVVTDHGHFVLFNVYGPRAGSDDRERIEFKSKFYKILQKRLEILLNNGRRIFVVGDLNIAPTAMDRCDAPPDFENDEFRRWFRSMLVQSGGQFVDIFRAKHPNRKEAYTCWPTNTGAEQFNYGTRIDHILYAGSCLHQENGHNFVSCHVNECDILTEYKRWKAENAPRYVWKGGLSMKLEGSDHAPVYVSLVQIPDIQQHCTPSLSARYLPVIRGLQQTLASVLVKRQTTTQVESGRIISSVSYENIASNECADGSSSNLSEYSNDSQSRRENSMVVERPRKKERKSSQLSLKSFFSVRPDSITDNTDKRIEVSSSSPEPHEPKDNTNLEKERNHDAAVEWRRIQELMQSSIPLCKGHKEPCVSRIVKKPGPNFQRRFYVCARAEGPASNPEANCGYFKWAAAPKSKQK